MDIPGSRPIAACLLVALLVTGSVSDGRTAASDDKAATAAESARIRAELPADPPSPSAYDPSATISVPPQPAELTKNPIYRTGPLPASRCAEPNHEPTSAASIRAYYTELLACMNKVWAPAIRRAGFTFWPPKLVVTQGRSASSPCQFADGLPYYCGDTIYMDAGNDLDFYDEEPDLARVWMPFNFAHEYGHHVQALTGIFAAKYQRAASLNGVDAALQETRRIELQASCLAGVYLGADRVWFPLTDDRLDDLYQLMRRARDPEHDHGRWRNQRRWLMAGVMAADPSACNTYTAGSDRVS